MKEYETYSDFAVCFVSYFDQKKSDLLYEKEKKTHKVIGKSVVRCTDGRFLDVKIQPGKGGGGRPIVKIQVQGKGLFIEYKDGNTVLRQ